MRVRLMDGALCAMLLLTVLAFGQAGHESARQCEGMGGDYTPYERYNCTLSDPTDP